MSDFFAIRRGTAPWGDYGDILWNGLIEGSQNLSEQSAIKVSRTGPFVPPIMQPFHQIIVDDDIRQTLEDSGYTGFGFVPVDYHHLVRIDWHLWDSSSDEPQIYPHSGEPEDYILAGAYDSSLQREMSKVWALKVSPTIGLQVEGSGTFRLSAHPGTDIAREAYIFWVSERMKSLLADVVGNWAFFTKVTPR